MGNLQPQVISVNISTGGIPKRPIESGRVTDNGIVGDGHHHAKHLTPMQAISLIDEEDLNDLRREGFDVFPGAVGENLTVRGLNVDALNVGDRVRFASGVEIELTKRRTACYVLDAISPKLKEVFAGRCGFLAKVITTGEIHPGEAIDVHHAAPDSA